MGIGERRRECRSSVGMFPAARAVWVDRECTEEESTDTSGVLLCRERGQDYVRIETLQAPVRISVHEKGHREGKTIMFSVP